MKLFNLIRILCILAIMPFCANNLYAENALYIPSITIQAGIEQMLSINLANTDDITAVQFDMKLPDGFSVNTYVNEDDETVPHIQLTERKKSKHQISCTETDDGCFRIVVLSMSNQTFRDNDGALVNVAVTASSSLSSGLYSISLSNIHLVTIVNGVQGDRIDQSDYTSAIAVDNESMSEDVDVRLSLETSSLSAGRKNQILSIALTNSIEITAFQFDMVLPQGITVNDYVNDDAEIVPDITLTGRKSASHQINSNRHDDGSYTVVVMSMKNKSFSGNSGTVVDLNVNVPLTMEGEYTVSLNNIHIVPLVNGAPGVRIDQEDVNFNFRVENNGGGESGGEDVEPEGSMVFFTEFLNLQPGEVGLLNINMKNEDEVCSFQFKLNLPDGIYIVKEYNEDDKYIEAISLSERKKSSHNLTFKQTDDGGYFLISYSLSNATYRDNSGAIVSVKVKADEEIQPGNYGVIISDAIMVTPEEKRYEIEDYRGIISITAENVSGFEELRNEISFFFYESAISVTGLLDGDFVELYTLQGIRIASAICYNGNVTVDCQGFENQVIIATVIRDNKYIKSIKVNL